MSSLCGSAIAGNRRRSTSTIAEVSSTLSVVCVTIGEFVRVARRERLRVRRPSATSVMAPAGSWPIVPITSTWPAWPIRTISRPSLKCRLASIWTLLTSGQVASRKNMLPRLGVGRHRLGHAMRRKHHRRVGIGGSRRVPRRTPRPSASARRPRICCGRWRGAHRPARHSSRAPARRSGWRGPRRRKSRAARRA